MKISRVEIYLLSLSALILSICNCHQAGAESRKIGASTGSYTSYDTKDPGFVRKFLRPGEYLHESQVRAGMEGYGLSVFRGTRIERFNVRVVGVMKRTLNGRDSILVRLSGKALGANNVVRGMSGSPIYINDKLIGALSYGFDFSKEPVAGVTPIVDMLDALAKPGDARLRRLSLSPRIDTGLGDIVGNEQDLTRLRRSMTAARAPSMVPLVAPIALSGYSERAKSFLKRRFARFDLELSGGASAGVDENLIKLAGRDALRLRPGSAVGLMLSTGDFASASTGTVTGVFGKRILAFGHPFLQAGAIDIPMTSSFVHDILPSLSISFKLSSPMKILGSVYADRPWSIGGELGKSARMIPITVEVDDEFRHIKKKFNSEVINHPDLAPDLLAATVISAIDASFQSAAPYVMHMDSTIEVDGEKPVVRKDRFSSSDLSSSSSTVLGSLPFFTDPAAGYVMSVTSRIYNNKFRKARIRGVHVKLRIKPGRDVSRIERVVVSTPVVKPGGRAKLRLTLKPYDGEKYFKDIEFEVPRDAPDGDLVVGVSSGSRFAGLRKQMRLTEPDPENLSQLIEKICEQPSSDELVAILALPDRAIDVTGTRIQSPPGHWMPLFFSDRYTNGPSLVKGERRLVLPMDTHMNGAHVVAFKVERPDKFLKRDAWFRAPATRSGKASSTVHVTSRARKIIDSSRKSSSKKSSSSSSSSSKTSTSVKKPKPWIDDIDDEVHTRAVYVWDQSTDRDFAGGTRKSVTVDSWGRIYPAFELAGSKSFTADVRAWSCAFGAGSYWFATSEEIYRWRPGDAAPTRVASLDSLLIPSLAVDSKGTLYAASVAGSGKVIAIRSDDTSPAEFFTPKERVITCLCVDEADNLFVGVAGSGRLYKLSSSGTLISTVDTGQAHVTSLFYDRTDRNVYIGTGEVGNVLKLSEDGKLSTVFQTDSHLVTGVARDSRGDLFIVTVGPGQLIRVRAEGRVENLATSDAFYTLLYERSSDSVIAGDAEGDITQIQVEPMNGRAFFVPVRHTDQEAVVGLASDNQGELVALTSNVPRILSFKLKPVKKPEFLSPVKDAQVPATWSRLRVFGAFNEINRTVAGNLSVAARTGNSAIPDGSWSPWQAAVLDSDGFVLKSPVGRFLQYRVSWDPSRFTSGAARVFPCGRENVVGKVTVTYKPANSAPVASTVSVKAGAYVSGEELVKVTASDPDGDNLALSVDVSADNAASWRNLEDDLRVEKKKTAGKKSAKKKSEKSKRQKNQPKEKKKESTGKEKKKSHRKTAEDSGKTEEKSQRSDKEKNGDEKKSTDKKKKAKDRKKRDGSKQADKKKKAGTAGKKKPKSKKKTPKSGSKKTSKSSSKKSKRSTSSKFEWKWKTKKMKDGSYLLRFSLSDSPSNGGMGTTTKVYRFVTIDNTKPKVSRVEISRTSDILKEIRVVASDRTSPVANVTVEIEEGNKWALIPESQVADSRQVAYIARGIKLGRKARRVTIEVTDLAGNKATRKKKI